jgi:hypothetical protein
MDDFNCVKHHFVFFSKVQSTWGSKFDAKRRKNTVSSYKSKWYYGQ